MNRLSKLFIITLLLEFTLSAAQSGVYIELGGGMGLNNTQKTKTNEYFFERGFIATASLGYQYKLWRFEIEERYKKDTLSSVRIDAESGLRVDGSLISDSQMFNTYFSGYNSSRFVTSVGLGVGMSALKLQESLKDTNILSLQAMLSVGYQLSKNFILSTKYRFFHTQESANFEANSDNELTFTLRYIF